MTKSFLTKKIFSIFAIFTFVLVSTTTLAHAGVIQNIKYFLFGEPTTPAVVTTPITNNTNNNTYTNTNIPPVVTSPSSSGISENDLYLALTKISRLPDNIISQLRGPQGPQGQKGDSGPKGPSGLSTYSATGNITTTTTPPVTNVYNTYTSSGGGSSSSSSYWKKKNDDIYYNKGKVAIGDSSFSGDSSLQVTGGLDTLGDEEIIHGNFDDDLSDDLVTDNSFSGTGWVDNGGGSFTHTAGQTASLTKDIGGLEGHFYRVYVDLSGGTQGELCWGVGDPNIFDGVDFTATGTVSYVGIAGGTEVFFDPTCGGGDMTGAYDGEISGISVEEIYWNYDSGEWTISDNKATHISGTGTLYQNGNLTPGVVYKVSAKIGGTTGTVVVALDDGADSGTGTHETFDAGEGMVSFFGISKNNYGIKVMFSPSADFNGTIEDVSLKPVTSSGIAQSWYDTSGNEVFNIKNSGLDSLNIGLGNFTVTTDGNVGIGTAYPSTTLTVDGDITLTRENNIFFEDYAGTAWKMNWMYAPDFTKSLATSYSLNLEVSGNANEGFAIGRAGGNSLFELLGSDGTAYFRGNVGIGNTAPSVALDVTGDIEYTGTITDVSDRRLKDNIQDYTGALDIISNLQAKSYNMISTPDKNEVGFIAQDVQSIFPNATSIIDPEKGYLGVSYVSLVPVIAEAVKELNLKLLDINKIEEPNSIREAIVAWFSNIDNGITKIFAGEIDTKKLCVSDNSGEATCVTKDQLDALLLNATIPPTPQTPSEPTPAPEIVPPPSTENNTEDTQGITTETNPEENATDTSIQDTNQTQSDTNTNTNETPPAAQQ